MIPLAAIVEVARSCIGTPFHHGQALKGVGCDCVGLLVIVVTELRMPEAEKWKNDLRFKGYGPTPLPEQLRAACREYLDPVPLSMARRGHILQYTFEKEPMHFAIISRDNPRYVIHGYERAGKVVENGAEATFWRLQCAYSFRGVA